jgi:hypothetical protein
MDEMKKTAKDYGYNGADYYAHPQSGDVQTMDDWVADAGTWDGLEGGFTDKEIKRDLETLIPVV